MSSSGGTSMNRILRSTKRIRIDTDELLGTDLMFPLQANNRGDLATISGLPNLRQAIIDIIEDHKGEVLYHEKMGVGISEKLHRPCTKATANELAFLIKEQILKYEARVKSIDITGEALPATSSDEQNTILLTVTYTDITYHHEDNFTYPLVLEAI